MKREKTVLEIRELKKSYSNQKVVRGINLDIREGEILGLLGPNGAGKTTTIKLLTGLTKPDGGQVTYYKMDFFQQARACKKFIGVVPQQSNLDRDLTAYENLYLHSILHGIPKNRRQGKIEAALEFAGLAEYKTRQVKTFSGGMKRRLVIVRALIHEPRILFLDEPTVGLDPQIRRSLWDLVFKVNQVRKTAILLTTHYIEEAEKLCHRIKIINSGSIIADDTPDNLKKGIGNYVLELFYDGQIEETFFDTREQALKKQETHHQESRIREVTLEDVFIKLTGRKINV
ncbi:MAG: ABC transporter ATP-binding protein [Deltaproteobacteria bacterium]|jgi:ABC-2 type transport system ATP-binding protein|nr:ABC transporter ATP-binding protein [Deltaproteobacteria bacterium]MBT4643540.1 ABC transporter ATP-binding protein [Deltaproteobacteria bacterium]MBT6500912.1 ABC transporter ATP-binding protein [Deltaproteobacteria bacterium]MBT6613582.1 ABC transporter ATP-binding protein [Deltaproteobacteria bacterium]MBT7154032.1 ABC transporter ATP-binding protein [Deltaproteobacteria bacterium]